jgi:hypothetical protein
LQGNGLYLIYTPEPNYNGPDSFTFIAADGMFNSNQATVNFWVWEVNDPPVVSDLQLVGSGDIPVSGQLAATDPEGEWLYYWLVSQPQNGTVTIDPWTGAFTYTPGPNGSGYDQFTYTVFDSQTQGNVATVQISSISSGP